VITLRDQVVDVLIRVGLCVTNWQFISVEVRQQHSLQI